MLTLKVRTTNGVKYNVDCENITDLHNKIEIIKHNGLKTAEGEIKPHQINAYICKDLLKRTK